MIKRLARTRNARTLQQAGVSLKRILNQLTAAETLDQLRGFEGNAARIYFRAIQQLVDPVWQFNGRNRQPPRDPVNALLSYGYTLLFYNIYSLIRARGLNPHVGYLHPLRMGHPALVSDMIEEFRSLVVDPIVWNLVLNGRLTPADFTTQEEAGCRMSESVRSRFIREMEKKLNASVTHPVSGLKLDYRRCIEHQVAQLATVIRGGQTEYSPMISR